MTRTALPLGASALLRLVASSHPALAGDIEESFYGGRSHAWLWRQLFAALVLSVWTRRRTTPTVVRLVTSSPFDRPDRSVGLLDPAPFMLSGGRVRTAGGLGLLATMVLITLVMPAAWFLVLIGLAGGAVVGFVLVRRRRDRGLGGPLDQRPIGLLGDVTMASSRDEGTRSKTAKFWGVIVGTA